MLLANKVAVITGASGDIGKKIVQKFSEEGANIYALVRDINDNSFNDFVKKLSTKFKYTLAFKVRSTELKKYFIFIHCQKKANLFF